MGIAMPLDLSGIDFALKIRVKWKSTDDDNAMRSENR